MADQPPVGVLCYGDNLPRTGLARWDFRKGLNTAFSADTKDAYELAYAKNARLGDAYGAVTKRAGSQRQHATAIGSANMVLGLCNWEPSAEELVAICNGHVFYKAQSDAEFTDVSGSLSTTNIPIFTRHVIAGTQTLFFAEGTLRKFTTGHSLSDVSGAPAGARFIRVYKGRMFATTNTKTIYWSKVADPETWASPDGGQANIDTYDAEAVVGLEVVGSSLFCFKKRSIARFTGVSQDNIQIDQQTEGIASDIGCIAPATIVRVEDIVFFLSDRGPYIATEAGVQAIGVKIEDAFKSVAPDHLANSVAAHNAYRQEIWLFIPPVGQTTNTTGYCYNYRQQAWTGPWSFPFAVSACCAHIRDNLSETVMLGGYAGFVRDGDVTTYNAKDDVLSDGTSGTAVTMQVDLPTLFFGNPTAVKRLTPTQQIGADLKTNGSLVVSFTGDLMSGSQSITLASKGAGVKQYLFRPGTNGRRITASFVDATTEIVQLNGCVLEAEINSRVA